VIARLPRQRVAAPTEGRQISGDCDSNHDAKVKLPLRAAERCLPDWASVVRCRKSSADWNPAWIDSASTLANCAVVSPASTPETLKAAGRRRAEGG